jgi:hypothetical protein
VASVLVRQPLKRLEMDGRARAPYAGAEPPSQRVVRGGGLRVHGDGRRLLQELEDDRNRVRVRLRAATRACSTGDRGRPVDRLRAAVRLLERPLYVL